MAVRYAKNPGELVIDNPAPRTKTKKRTMARKKHTSKKKRRRNPGVVKTGESLFLKYGIAAAGSILTVRLLQAGLNKFGGNLPEVVKKYVPVVAPAVGGIYLATKNKGKIMQGIAGGMILASVNSAVDAFIPSASASGMSDYPGVKYLADDASGSLLPPAPPVPQLNYDPSSIIGYLGDEQDDMENQEELFSA